MVEAAKLSATIKLVTKEFKDYNINDLRNLSDDIKASYKGIVMVFATVNGPKVTFLVSITDDLLEKGFTRRQYDKTDCCSLRRRRRRKGRHGTGRCKGFFKNSRCI